MRLWLLTLDWKQRSTLAPHGVDRGVLRASSLKSREGGTQCHALFLFVLPVSKKAGIYNASQPWAGGMGHVGKKPFSHHRISGFETLNDKAITVVAPFSCDDLVTSSFNYNDPALSLTSERVDTYEAFSREASLTIWLFLLPSSASWSSWVGSRGLFSDLYSVIRQPALTCFA